MNGRGARPPTPLTGGVGRTAAAERTLPDIGVAEPAPGYATLIVQGWDSYQECLNVHVPPELAARLEAAKLAAAERDDRGGALVDLALGNETIQVRPHGGKGGAKWVFGNDDFLVMVRSPAQEWNVSVRYLAAGLWEHGLEMLQNRVWDMLLSGGGCKPRSDDAVRVTRADWAFDLWSAGFSAEMRPEIARQVVCHSSSKKRQHVGVDLVGRAGRVETLTVGSKAGLEIQVYDKTLEISEASGKTWMIELWEREGFHPPDGEVRDVWRVEIRMGGDYLKNRDVRTPAQLAAKLPELLTEALWTRRLTAPTDDSNHRRWPLHPLFTIAWRSAGCTTLPPIGRHVTQRRSALHRVLVLQVAGTLRAASVLQAGAWSRDEAEETMTSVWNALLSDPRAGPKEAAARERYRYVDEAA